MSLIILTGRTLILCLQHLDHPVTHLSFSAQPLAKVAPCSDGRTFYSHLGPDGIFKWKVWVPHSAWEVLNPTARQVIVLNYIEVTRIPPCECPMLTQIQINTHAPKASAHRYTHETHGIK